MKVTIYRHSDHLPELTTGNFFHSRELMALCEHTPRLRPYMAVVTDDDNNVQAYLLAIMRFRRSWFPPYLYTHVRIYGDNGCDAEQFGLIMKTLTRLLQNRTLYIELSNLHDKMFGYRELRQQRYFPVRWMNIHNSLHSRTPEERIDEQQLQRIMHAQERGAITKPVETLDEFEAFSKLLRSHHWFKPKRYIPDERLFRELKDDPDARLFLTKYKNKVIGCCACTYSGTDAYLWYSAFRRKSYLRLHPDVTTVWHALYHAYEHHYDHMRFMDVGLPFKRNSFREFILSFGGKPVSTYRWFRCNIGWINRLLEWIYKD